MRVPPLVARLGDTEQEEQNLRMVRRDASVTIEAAAELANVDVLTIRRWSADGVLQIERRGEMEAVRLAEVDALATARTSDPKKHRGALRGLLREATRSETLDVSELQQLVRERTR
jgi:hypothetical protein